MGKNILADAEAEHCFWLNDGTKIKNLQELSESMDRMSDDTFKHHVNPQKNDFYNWVRDIYEDAKLAGSLLKSTTKEETTKSIKDRISEIKLKKRVKVEMKIKREKIKKAKEPKNAAISRFLSSNSAPTPSLKDRIPTTTPKLAEAIARISDKPYAISVGLFAVFALIGIAALTNVVDKPAIAGSAVMQVQQKGYNLLIIAVSTVISTLITTRFILRKKSR